MATITSASPEQTIALGRSLAETLSDGDILAIDGDLGSGKTHLIKGIALGLEITEEVTSPTFTLVHEYLSGRYPLYHFDFYRFDSEEDLVRSGFEEYLQLGGVIAIEWAGRFPGLVPRNARWYRMECGEDDLRVLIPLDRSPTS
jgi:tRNA threonylcarbamoyladenosine biosynthesis protein TsaE